MKILLFAILFVDLLSAGILPGRGAKAPAKTPLDEYLEAVRGENPAPARATPGSAYVAHSRLGDLARDFRATQAGDIVTVVVVDRANAVSTAGATADRTSEASGGVSSVFGKLPGSVAGRLGDLASVNGASKLQGQGETSRSSTLQTTLAARVVEVLPNGNLVIEGRKSVTVNAERQLVEVRGVVRWNDVNAQNQIRSDRIAQMDLRINGKGLVGDAVRRPNILYRALLGILPF